MGGKSQTNEKVNKTKAECGEMAYGELGEKNYLPTAAHGKVGLLTRCQRRNVGGYMSHIAKRKKF